MIASLPGFGIIYVLARARSVAVGSASLEPLGHCLTTRYRGVAHSKPANSPAKPAANLRLVSHKAAYGPADIPMPTCPLRGAFRYRDAAY